MNLAAERQPEVTLPHDEYIDLNALWDAAWQRKIFIISAMLLIGIASVAVTLSMPNVYQSSALLAPVAQERPRGLSSLAGGFSALAGLAGLNLGGVAVDSTTIAMQTLTSRKFLTEFAKRHQLVIPLFAAKGWDPVSRKWVIDPSIYDEKKGTWVRSVEPPRQQYPADWEIFEAFSEMVSVEQDPNTSLVRISVESQSPEAAKLWTDQLVQDVNSNMRAQDLAEANRSIQSLEQRLAQTSVSEIRLATFQLIEDQMKTVMLAEARPEYVFRIIDPAVVPAIKSWPKRALICILATLLGGVVATVGAVIFHFRTARTVTS